MITLEDPLRNIDLHGGSSSAQRSVLSNCTRDDRDFCSNYLTIRLRMPKVLLAKKTAVYITLGACK